MTKKAFIMYWICVLLLFLSLFSFLLLGKLDPILYNNSSIVISSEKLFADAKDFVIKKNRLRSTSTDSWLRITVPKGVYKSIDINVNSMSVKSTKCAVYYRLSAVESFSEKNSVYTVLEQGIISIPLPDKEIDSLRIDLTDEKSIIIEIDQITLNCKKTISFRNSFLLLCGICVLIIGLVPISSILPRIFYSCHKTFMHIATQKPKILLTLLMFVSIIICFRTFLTGNEYFAYLDIGSDTVYVYQPFWFSIADDLKKWNISEWTMNYGLGASTLTQLSWLVDPFIWPTIVAYLLCGFSTAQVIAAWMQGVKLLLCALVCYDFLSEYSLSRTAKVISSYAYGFCGFVVLWGQHYAFSTAFFIGTLTLLLLERCLKNCTLNKNHFFLSLSIAWLVGKTYYFAYMILICLASYTIVRLFLRFPIKAVKKWITCGSCVLLSVLIGFVISSILLLPQIFEITSVSDRIQSDWNLLQYLSTYPKDHNITIISRFLSNNLLGTTKFIGYSNYYEAEQLFYTSFLPLFFIIYIYMGLDEGRKIFVERLLACIALNALPFIPVTGYIMNGFVTPVGRYTFVFVPIYSVVAAKSIDGIISRKVKLPALITTGILYLGVVFVIYNHYPQFSVNLCALILVEFLILATFIALYHVLSIKSQIIRIAIIMVIMLNVLGDAIITTNERRTLTDRYDKNEIEVTTQEIKAIVQSIRETDPELFRIEKAFSNYSYFNDALVEDYYGISYYNSTINYRIKNFFINSWDAVIFKNKGAYIQFEKDYSNTKMAALLGTKYIISKTPIDNNPGYQYVTNISGKNIYKNLDYMGFGRFYTGAITYDEYVEYPLEERQKILQDYLIMDEKKEKADANAKVVIEQPLSEDHLLIDVSSSEDGFLFLPIPYEKGWEAYLNGQQLNILIADYGFMAIPLLSGDSHIELQFHIPYLKIGAYISCTGLFILGTIYLSWSLYQKKKGVCYDRF